MWDRCQDEQGGIGRFAWPGCLNPYLKSDGGQHKSGCTHLYGDLLLYSQAEATEHCVGHGSFTTKDASLVVVLADTGSCHRQLMR